MLDVTVKCQHQCFQKVHIFKVQFLFSVYFQRIEVKEILAVICVTLMFTNTSLNTLTFVVFVLCKCNLQEREEKRGGFSRTQTESMAAAFQADLVISRRPKNEVNV